MTENITEYTYPPISTQDFEEWKKTWNEKDPIPEKIHDYMQRVVFKRIEKTMDDWDKFERDEL